MNEIRFQKPRNNKPDDMFLAEEWGVSSDSRHSVVGYRAQRYIADDEDPLCMNWDESNMFFVSLDEAYRAFESGDLDAGGKAF